MKLSISKITSMKYWVIIDDIRKGPLSLEQLKDLNLAENTPIWHAGLEEWTTIDKIPEVKALIQRTTIVEEVPITQVSFSNENNTEKCPPTYMVWAVLSTLCCCLPLGVVAIVFSSQVAPKYRVKDYDGARKASERAALWVILSFVLGLITFPLQMLLSMI